ncbi:MAG TPA: SDR family oxidoreductase, partial [Dokdonella sp.]|nr:SDR family oxidoreductase [Dokdonella sp.]
MDLDLTGKHALVLGASQGIGRAAAHELATLGADVTVLARSNDALEAIVAALPRRSGQNHGFVAADMNEHAALRARVEALVNVTPVQILVNNTGGPPGGPAHTATLDEFRIAFNQHLMAAQIVVQAILPGMRAAGYGRIINVISTSVKEPIRNLGVSNSIRGAVASWAKTLAGELGPAGITVNNVLPGYTKTQRLEQILADRAQASGESKETVSARMLASVPLDRFAEPHEVAAAIAFLASPAAAYVNGINLPVDGGR